MIIRYFVLFASLFLLAGVNVSVDDGNISTQDNGKNQIMPFENLDIEAESVVVLDLNSEEVIFAKEADLKRPLASLTKLVTAGIFYERAPSIFKDGQLLIPMTLEALLQDGDDGFSVGESYAAGDLLDVVLVKSSNDAAYALSIWLQEHYGNKDSFWFVNEMNLFVSKLNLQNTYFLNPTGLDENEDVSGGYSTASETARLFLGLLRDKYELIEVTRKPEIEVYSLEGKKHIFKSTALPILGIPGIIAAKTGYTDLAGGNLVWAFGVGPGRQFVAVVLGSSYEGRFLDAIKIYEAVLQYIQGV